MDLNASGTGINDISGNAIAGGFITGQTYTIQQGIPELTAVRIGSDNSIASLAKPGNVISLSFTASEPINPPTVTIGTHGVTATAGGGNSELRLEVQAGADMVFMQCFKNATALVV